MPVRAMFAIHTQAGQSSSMVYSIPSVQNTWYIFVFFKVNLEFHIDNALSYTIYFYMSHNMANLSFGATSNLVVDNVEGVRLPRETKRIFLQCNI